MLGMMKTQAFPKPLSKQQEEEYLIGLRNHDPHAREELITHNLRLVAHIAKKYDIQRESSDDLISAGTIGLIKGIDSYDVEKGKKLTTYIAKCIENEILMYLRSQRKKYQTVSLDEGIAQEKDDSEITLLDVIPNEKTIDPIEAITTKDSLKRLRQYFTLLDPREQEILSKRYGLNGEQEMTQREIAQQQNISRSYVSRIEKRAFLKLLRMFIKNKD